MPNYLTESITLKRIHLMGVFTLLLIILLIVWFFRKSENDSSYSLLPGYKIEFEKVDPTTAKEMVEYFHSTFPRVISSAGREIETPRAVHFDLGLLAKYMHDVHFNKRATGIRVYFGRYKQTELRPSESGPIDYKDHITTIFVPTKIVDGVPVDIFDEGQSEPLYQPYNGGISCPPLPARNCKGQKL